MLCLKRAKVFFRSMFFLPVNNSMMRAEVACGFHDTPPLIWSSKVESRSQFSSSLSID